MTESGAPLPSRGGRKLLSRSATRPIVGLATILVIAAIIALCAMMFRGSFAKTVAVTVISPRAGLVMNPDAKVKMLGVQIGKVASIENLADGQAALHLEIDPSQLHVIPANVAVDIASTTAFGAKFVQLVPPAQPSAQAMQPGQVLDADRVTVEFNTVFEQLTSVLSAIDPAKLNATLAAISSALNGRGKQAGQMLGNLDHLLAAYEPSLPSLSHDLSVAPEVFNAYADAAPDLTATMANTTQISQTLVDQQHNLDAFLVSTIGLADIGNDVVTTNRQALTDVLHLLVPTTNLTNEYNTGLTCTLKGVVPLVNSPPMPFPGIVVMTGTTLGIERYRYPANLPKVAATGGPHCMDMPNVPPETNEPFLVTDTGANPWQYGNQGILLNSDGLKQWLFGPLDGPPRNTAQIGMPG